MFWYSLGFEHFPGTLRYLDNTDDLCFPAGLFSKCRVVLEREAGGSEALRKQMRDEVSLLIRRPSLIVESGKKKESK